MTNLLLVALGGAIGSALRYLISTAAIRLVAFSIPVGTLTVNLAGALFIGFLWGFFQIGETALTANTQLCIFTGLLGGFTTFSAVALETFNLLRNGNMFSATVYISATNILGVLLAFMGYVVALKVTQL